MGHAHKSLPVGMVCHQMNTPSLAHPQALPLHTIIRTYRWAIFLYPKLESETIPICHQNPPSTLGKKNTLLWLQETKAYRYELQTNPYGGTPYLWIKDLGARFLTAGRIGWSNMTWGIVTFLTSSNNTWSFCHPVTFRNESTKASGHPEKMTDFNQ